MGAVLLWLCSGLPVGDGWVGAETETAETATATAGVEAGAVVQLRVPHRRCGYGCRRPADSAGCAWHRPLRGAASCENGLTQQTCRLGSTHITRTCFQSRVERTGRLVAGRLLAVQGCPGHRAACSGMAAREFFTLGAKIRPTAEGGCELNASACVLGGGSRVDNSGCPKAAYEAPAPPARNSQGCGSPPSDGKLGELAHCLPGLLPPIDAFYTWLYDVSGPRAPPCFQACGKHASQLQ
jgi:hypothetical protein